MNVFNRIEFHLMHYMPHGVCCINMAPETYTESSGLLDDVDVQFVSCKFVTWDYGKANQKAAPFLKIDMLPEGTMEIHTEYMRCGDLEHWSPTADGETLAPQSGKAKDSGGIAKNCNAAIFLTSLVQAGMPGSKLASERISDLVGLKVHVVRTKRAKDNIKRDEGAREPQVLTVSRIVSMPWDGPQTPQAAPGATAARQVAPSPTPAKREPIAANGNFGDAELAMLAVQILGEHGGALKKIQLMQEVYKAAVAGAVPADAKDGDGKPARTTVSQRIFNDQFLESQSYWQYDGTSVRLK